MVCLLLLILFLASVGQTCKNQKERKKKKRQLQFLFNSDEMNEGSQYKKEPRTHVG